MAMQASGNRQHLKTAFIQQTLRCQWSRCFARCQRYRDEENACLSEAYSLGGGITELMSTSSISLPGQTYFSIAAGGIYRLAFEHLKNKVGHTFF